MAHMISQPQSTISYSRSPGRHAANGHRRPSPQNHYSRPKNTVTPITRAYPAAARRGNIVRAAAVLDVAFDHLLYGLHERDVYEPLDVTFKGGTALRKFYIGHRGRFSFDLDFDVAEGAEDLLAEEVDGMVFPHFEFTVRERRRGPDRGERPGNRMAGRTSRTRHRRAGTQRDVRRGRPRRYA